jgi:cobalt-precorrin-5B (C1)-methyltransferase
MAEKFRPAPITLRHGFSTGAYAAATAVAAWRCLRGKSFQPRLPLWFADGQVRSINVDGAQLRKEGNAEAWARKDAGDDLDITHRATVRTRMEYPARKVVRPEDFSEPCGDAVLIIRGGEGIGLARRPGLDIPPGKWAINPVPRAMIVDNLRRDHAGDRPACFSIELAIDNGEKLARHTLNPVLGIEGGLSILGTTGLVIPCSHAAYVDTIGVLVRGATAAGAQKIALATGGKTHRAIREMLPEIPEYACIRCGDFIYEALSICAAHNLGQVIIACMPGKLAKYAQGHANTHARQVRQDLGNILFLLEKHGFRLPDQNARDRLQSVREFLETLPAGQQQQAIAILKKEAARIFRQWAPGLESKILVFDSGGKMFPAKEPA